MYTPPARLPKLPLLSGEVHYFRIDPSEWRRRILDAKEAGLNAVSTYIPWNWHEVEEGVFDFSGSMHPQRNLELFLEIAEEEEILVIARPGPYICAEWLYGGIPPWLLERHPEVLALNSSGKPTKFFSRKSPVICYLHPTYVKFAERWMRRVSEVIKRHEASKGGCIPIVQVDNESSYGFHFSPFDADYNPVVVGKDGREGLYQEWLKSKFPSITQLNEAYGTRYVDFSEVEPPRALEEKRNLKAVLDWIEFKEQMIALFLKRMANAVRSAGVDSLLVTNEFFIPFLYPPIQAKSQFLIDAVDLYPHYLDEETFLAATNYLELFRGYQPEAPLLVAELQSGWFSYKTSKNTPHVLSRLAHVKGARMVNFYMFSGGINPGGFGTTGKLYFSDAPVSPRGKKNDKYYTVKLFASAVRASPLMNPIHEIHVAYCHRYTLAEIAGGRVVFGRKYRTSHASFRRLLLSFLKNGLSYSIIPIELLDQHNSPLIFYAFDFLPEEKAERLIRYVENGGVLVLTPQAPILDEGKRLFNSLAGALGVTSQSVRSGVVSFAGRREKMSSVTVFKIDGGEPLAFLNGKHVCCFKAHIGKGVAIQLGFTPGEASLITWLIPSLKPAYKANRVLACLSKGEEGYGLFVCNLERRGVEGIVLLSLPDFESTISFSLPGRGCAIWPIKRKLKFGELLYATAELIEVEEDNLVFWSYEGSRGEVKLKLSGPPSPLPEGAYWDAKSRTLNIRFHTKTGENTVMKDPFRLAIIGVKRPELEGVRERVTAVVSSFRVGRFK
ncbi:MAG: beta-galactosidase [Candidatus Freyarchaeota archaeon]|nr:beta-galactosidase [Candidatus Jordarchaeia archaeon]